MNTSQKEYFWFPEKPDGIILQSIFDFTKIENVTKDHADSTGNIPEFRFLRNTSMPSEKSPDNLSVADNSKNRNADKSIGL